MGTKYLSNKTGHFNSIVKFNISSLNKAVISRTKSTGALKNHSSIYQNRSLHKLFDGGIISLNLNA